MNNYSTLTEDILEDPFFELITDNHQTVVNDARLVGHEDLIVWSIGDEQIIVYPNPEVNEITTDITINSVSSHLNNINNLGNMGIPTCNASDAYVQKNDIFLPVSLSPSSEGLKEKGIYILSTHSLSFPRTWEGGLFSQELNTGSASVWYPVVKNLFYDIVKLKGNVKDFNNFNLTYAVFPADVTNIISKYEVRYIGLELYDTIINSGAAMASNKSNKITEDIIEQVGTVIGMLMEIEKIPGNPIKIAKDVHSGYLAPKKFKLEKFEESTAEMSKLPEYIPRDLENLKIEHFINQISSIERILGPDDYKVYTLNDQLIYLFRDIHSPTEVTAGKLRTATLREYFDYFFHNSPVTCDLFLEVEVFLNVPHNPEYQGYWSRMLRPNSAQDELSKVVEKYARCLGKVKQGCHKFGNVRFHNIDFRRVANPDYNLSDIRQLLDIALSPDIDSLDDYIMNIPRYLDAFRSLLFGDLEGAAENFRVIYKDVPQLLNAYETETFMDKSGYDKLFKQFQHIPKREELIDYFINRMDILVTTSIPEDEDQATKIQLIEDFHFKFELLFMDAYAIARLIKSVFLYGKNISLLYSGKAHTSVYADILTDIYGATGVINIESANQYVDVSMINQDQLRTEMINTIFID